MGRNESKKAQLASIRVTGLAPVPCPLFDSFWFSKIAQREALKPLKSHFTAEAVTKRALTHSRQHQGPYSSVAQVPSSL